MLVGEFQRILETKKQQFNTPGFMPVNFSNSVKAVELKFLQVEEKPNDGTVKNFISIQNNAAMQGKVTICDIM